MKILRMLKERERAMRKFIYLFVLMTSSATAQTSIATIARDGPSTGTFTDALSIFLVGKSDSQRGINGYNRFIAPNSSAAPRELERVIRASALSNSDKFDVYMATMDIMTRAGARGFGRMLIHVTELRPILLELGRTLRTKTLTKARADLDAIEAEPLVE